jgi:ABC-type Fe3+ transport system substrate-binding protein
MLKNYARMRLRIWLLTFSAIISLHAFLLLSLVHSQVPPDWKTKWDKVLAGATKEGKVVVFGPPGELVRRAVTEGFKKSYPNINLEYSGGAGGDLGAKVRAEREGGIYSVDVVIAGSTTSHLYFKPFGALDPLKPALLLPEVADLKYWRNNTLEFSDKEGVYNLVFSNVLRVLVMYNPRDVDPSEVDDLDKLLHPKWKGKIVVNNPMPSGAGYMTFHWLWRILGPEKATDYYKKLRAQTAIVDRDQRRQIEWIAQGKYPILLGGNSPIANQLLSRGLKVGMISEFKELGSSITAAFGSISLMNRAPNPNAAALFVNWALGKEAQLLWSKATGDVSLRVDVPHDHVPPYMIPKPDGRLWSDNYKPGDRYWVSYFEGNTARSPEEEKIMTELFGR